MKNDGERGLRTASAASSQEGKTLGEDVGLEDGRHQDLAGDRRKYPLMPAASRPIASSSADDLEGCPGRDRPFAERGRSIVEGTFESTVSIADTMAHAPR